ncbi:hypothetical protein LC979_13810, partial [Enterococcus faecium]|nr:hypothetical protein [Enterococcus faecium]
MNKEWSELNKTMQAQIKKKDTYKRGIDTLLTLRSQLIQTLVSFKEELCREDFNRIRQKSPILYRWVMNAVRYEGYR